MLDQQMIEFRFEFARFHWQVRIATPARTQLSLVANGRSKTDEKVRDF